MDSRRRRARFGARALAAVSVFLAAIGPASAAPAETDALAADPGLIEGTLPNGVRYWIAPNHAARGQAAIWMRIAAGSLHEAAGEEGLAHLVEHMAFRGTEHYPHGSVTRKLQSLGLTFGTDENAYTTLRGTTYELNLPRSTPLAGGEAMTVLADFAFRRAATRLDVARERPIVLEELRSADKLSARIENEVFAASAAGTRAASHLPLGRDEVVRRAGPSELDAFVARWYRPERTAIIVTGDVDPDVVIDLIRREFAAFQARTPPPPEPSPLAGADGAKRAFVITDAEQPWAELRAIHLEPTRPVHTVSDLRRRLGQRLAVWLLDQRLREGTEAGGPLRDGYSLITSGIDGAATEAEVHGSARTASWKGLVAALVTAADDAAGSTPSESRLREARAALLADARARASVASTRPPATVAAELSAELASGDTPLSPAQRLTLTESLLPQIGADEVGAASRQTFSPKRRRLVLIVPSRMPGDPPRPPQVARLARRASLVTRSAWPAPTERDTGAGPGLLDDDPEPGEVSEQSEDPQSETTSLTLSNGVRVHVRPMTERSDEVRVQVTLAGGELLETAATRGLSEAAALAFEAPATDSLSGAAIRAALVGHDVALSGCACDGDAITAELVTGRTDLETGMRLLHLVLTRGRVTKAALDDWKARDLAWASRETSDPELRVSDELPATLTERDPRARPLSASQVSRVDLGAAQTWLEHHRDTAPMEVAMVGDADRAELIRLARKYLGSLPARPRHDVRLEALRRPQPSGPAAAAVTFPLDGIVPRAAIAVTWRRPDRESALERDAIEVGAAVLAERLRQELRERRGLTYDVSFDLAQQGALRGTNVMTASLSTDPRHVYEAAQLVRRVVASFAAAGPTPEELATARRQVQSQRAADARRPSAWADLLAAQDYRGASSTRLAEPVDRLDAVAAGDVRAAVGRCVAGQAAVTIVAAPRWNLVFGLREPRRPAVGNDASAGFRR